MAEQIALNCDCMEYMRIVPDKYFDLACVDPPYGDASQAVNVERERESRPRRGAEIPPSEGKIRRARQLGGQVRSWRGSRGRVGHGQRNTKQGVSLTRTYEHGTKRRRKSISMSFSV